MGRCSIVGSWNYKEGEGCAALNCSDTGTWKEEMLYKKWSLISEDCTKLHWQSAIRI